MVDTKKFSEFISGGDLENSDTTVGLKAGTNAQFNNPWTFLKPGTTGDRPMPSASTDYRLRFNTSLEVYEYYDPTTMTWAQLSGSGTGTVNPGVANDIAFYAANGQAVSPVASAPNAVLRSNGSGVPSMSTTLPSGLSIPGASITASTAALTSGSVVAVPISGNDLVNKTYADSLFGSGVQSLTGTTNQITFSSPTGNVTASLPQDIALGSTPTFAGMTLTSIPLGSSSGGTGVNNGGRTLTLAGNLSTVGAFSSAFTMTGATNVTFPTSGILATTGQIPTGAALTKTDDTNVTLTLGGSPLTALVNAASLTLGWTGLLSKARGGTSVASATIAPTSLEFAAWDTNLNLSANAFIPKFFTQVTTGGITTLTIASQQIQEFTGTLTQTVVMPVVSTLPNGFYFDVINNSTGALTVNTSGGNLIVSMGANTTARIVCVNNTLGIAAGAWNASYVFDNGAGVLSVTGTANQVLASSSTGNIVLSLPQSIATTSAVTFASVAFSGTSGVIGTTTNNNAAAGSVGELVSSVVLSGSAVALTSTTDTNVTSISLTAGDWDVFGNVSFLYSANLTQIIGWSSASSATIPNGALYSALAQSFTAANGAGITIPGVRYSLAGTTTIYLSCRSTFTGTCTGFGGIYARRRR